MKKSTVWKLASVVLLVAVLLPVFSVLGQTPVSATSTAPLPYALERYGQRHVGIYKTDLAPVADGVMDPAYALMDTVNASDTKGVFGSKDGTTPGSYANEFLPGKVEYYAAYDEEYLYLYITALDNVSANGYEMSISAGFDFSETQGAALGPTTQTYTLSAEGVQSISLSDPATYVYSNEGGALETESRTYTAANYNGKYSVTVSSPSTGMALTTYEVALAWEDLAQGKDIAPEEDFDRFYFATKLRFDMDDGFNYWHYAFSAGGYKLDDGTVVKDAFHEEFGYSAYSVPNVVNLMGAMPMGEYAAPLIGAMTATEGDGKTVTVPVSVGSCQTGITEIGILATESIAVGNRNLKVGQTSATGTNKLGLSVTRTVAQSAATTWTGTDRLNATLTFTTAPEEYDAFFSARPYVKYADGTVVYGSYASFSPAYFDINANKTYTDRYNVFMIGNSFCTYFGDELVGIAASDKLYFDVWTPYESGCHMVEQWTWLISDFKKMDGTTPIYRLTHWNPEMDTSEYFTTPMSMKECLAKNDTWDAITLQEHYNPIDQTDMAFCVDEIMPYAQNLKNYFAANYPEATVYWHQTWAYQVGWAGGGGTNGAINRGTVPNKEYQAVCHNGIRSGAIEVCRVLDMPRIPNGDAWAMARANEKIGDVLCRSDLYHDGEEGGGQYLNACVYYEVITHNDVRGNTFRPAYDMSMHGYTAEERIVELQNIAHEIVSGIYGDGYYNN